MRPLKKCLAKKTTFQRHCLVKKETFLKKLLVACVPKTLRKAGIDVRLICRFPVEAVKGLGFVLVLYLLNQRLIQLLSQQLKKIKVAAVYAPKMLRKVAAEIGMPLQFQAFSRGGSDASCSASRGLCARPFTLGLPMENSHGFEIMHRDAMDRLADLTVALVERLA